jgi:superfamily II DNA or RNA helicase
MTRRRMLLEPSPSVRDLVVNRLVPLFFRAGSLSALTDLLNRNLPESGSAIHPNRLRQLLAEDPTRAVNPRTLDAVERASASALAFEDGPSVDGVADVEVILRQRVLDLVVARHNGSASIASAALTAWGQELGLPPAIVRHLLETSGQAVEPFAAVAPPGGDAVALRQALDATDSGATAPSSGSAPDWSYQDTAVQRCMQALAAGIGRKVGLVIPTGGGKTRIALRIALQRLHQADNPAARAAWITHRRTLRKQAREALQELVTEESSELPADAGELLNRIDFVMVSKAEEYLQTHTPSLVVIDEAHHAAAESYRPVVEASAVPGLFLTATPVRTDRRGIGVDEIAFSITYRDLAERGVVLRPEFQPLDVSDFDWGEEALGKLAQKVLDEAEGRYIKTLIIAPGVEKAEVIYEHLREELLDRDDHVLSVDDIGFVHSTGNSLNIDSDEFIDVFTAKPRAILVSVDMLLEGFDDPHINAVVMTYPSTSLIKLMQAAGRCVRYAPGKKAAYVLQARNEALTYYYDHRWLYQEISDFLRPRLIDVQYDSSGQLQAHVSELLEAHNVSAEIRSRCLARLTALKPGELCRLLLTGMPYYGDAADFGGSATWSAVLEIPENSQFFRTIFNEFCELGADRADPEVFLRRYAVGDQYEVRSYRRMLLAMQQARREIFNEEPRYGSSRGYRPHGPTTWLTYVTFHFRPHVPPALQAFVATCVNREPILQDFARRPADWVAAVRVRLPLGAHYGFLLTACQLQWLRDQRDALLGRLKACAGPEQWHEMHRWQSELRDSPLPLQLLENTDHLLTDEMWAMNALLLTP